LSVTHWDLDDDGNIHGLPAQTIVNNASLFPGYVIRASSCSGAPPCPITRVIRTFLNFGAINVRGFDYQMSYTLRTSFGQWLPSLSATDTYRYTSALQPGLPQTDRTSKANDDGNFAPRWRGIAALGWKLGPYAANVNGRYLGSYQDYDSTREIGNVWLCDVNFRYAVGDAIAHDNQWLRGAYFELGGVNVFNRQPEYSNYEFGSVGYDTAEADIRGRFLYGQIGLKW